MRPLLTETESGIVAEIHLQREPTQLDPVGMVEVALEVRSTQLIVVIPQDRTPQDDRLHPKEITEDPRDTFCPNGQPILQIEASGEGVRVSQVVVNHLTLHAAILLLLLVVKPQLQRREVVLRGAGALQLGVDDLLHPVGIAQLARPIPPVHTDDEVRGGIRLEERLNGHVTILSQLLAGAENHE